MAKLKTILNHLLKGTFLTALKKKYKKKPAPNDNAPVGDTYYGDRAADYLQTRHQQEYWHLEQKLIVDLLDQLPKGSSVLDVPFGTGRFVKDYLRNSFDVQGLDASKDMIEVGRRELGTDFDEIKVTIGDATKLPYPDQSFDYVVCIRFLTHIVNFEQAKQVLEEFKRVTRKQLFLQVRMRLDSCPQAPPPNPDQQIGDRFNLTQFTEFLNTFGFSIDKIEYLEERETYHRAVIICSPSTTE